LDARSAALIAVFSAIAISLNAIRIPSVFWPGFSYGFYEIPVLVAFIIYGFKIGYLVEIVHIMGQEIFFPMGVGAVVVYPMGLIFHTFMFSGIYLANKLINRKIAKGKNVSEKKTTIYFTGLATVLRGGLMPIIDYTVLYSILLPFALGHTIPETYTLALIPAFIAYNITNTLYAVPIAYLIAKKTSSYLTIKAKYLPN
jgi:riboflavin transporter FmnP